MRRRRDPSSRRGIPERLDTSADRGPSGLALFACALLFCGGLFFLFDGTSPRRNRAAEPATLHAQPAETAARPKTPPSISLTPQPPAPAGSPVGAMHFTICGRVRFNCVVDGDTFWYRGEKIRVADIDTPEVSKPGCAAERALGVRATMRFLDLLNEGPFELVPADRDRDRYGRSLRHVHRNGASLGHQLIKEGLARPWEGRRRPWC